MKKKFKLNFSGNIENKKYSNIIQNIKQNFKDNTTTIGNSLTSIDNKISNSKSNKLKKLENIDEKLNVKEVKTNKNDIS